MLLLNVLEGIFVFTEGPTCRHNGQDDLPKMCQDCISHELKGFEYKEI